MGTPVKIWGPNLRDQRKGTFHIHAAACGDNGKYARELGPHGGWEIDAESASEVAQSVYGDMIDEGSMTVDDALGDIWFAPCLQDLPTTAPAQDTCPRCGGDHDRIDRREPCPPVGQDNIAVYGADDVANEPDPAVRDARYYGAGNTDRAEARDDLDRATFLIGKALGSLGMGVNERADLARAREAIAAARAKIA